MEVKEMKKRKGEWIFFFNGSQGERRKYVEKFHQECERDLCI